MALIVSGSWDNGYDGWEPLTTSHSASYPSSFIPYRKNDYVKTGAFSMADEALSPDNDGGGMVYPMDAFQGMDVEFTISSLLVAASTAGTNYARGSAHLVNNVVFEQLAPTVRRISDRNYLVSYLTILNHLKSEKFVWKTETVKFKVPTNVAPVYLYIVGISSHNVRWDDWSISGTPSTSTYCKDAGVWKPSDKYVKDNGIWKPAETTLKHDNIWKDV